MVRFDAFPGKTFEAKVTNRSLAADPMNGSFSVELRVAFNGEKPATGMFGKATILNRQNNLCHRNTLCRPAGSRWRQRLCICNHDKKTVQRKEVKLGKLYNDRVEVLPGLETIK
jgi:membrane fusion protein, multidrug efflux system